MLSWFDEKFHVAGQARKTESELYEHVCGFIHDLICVFAIVCEQS